jgi:hypothetical protein
MLRPSSAASSSRSSSFKIWFQEAVFRDTSGRSVPPAIATAAVQNEVGGAQMIAACRKAEIVTDAAHYILTRPASGCSGNFFLDDEVLLAVGGRDFAQYDVQAGAAPQADFFIEALPGMLPSAI